MKGQFQRSLIIVILLAFSSTWLFAKDLGGRMGIGFSDLSLTSTETNPAISFKIGFTEYMTLGVSVGLDTQKNDNKLTAGAKLFRNAFLEENCNFYVGAGVFVNTQKTPATNNENKTGFIVTGFIGAEFFFQGLPNLGFSFETGISLDTIGSVRFRTAGNSFVTSGIHYYF